MQSKKAYKNRLKASNTWRINHPERHNFLNKRWNKKNPEKVKIIKKRNYMKNPEKARQAVKNWQKNNPELLKKIRDNSARKHLYKIRKEQFEQMKKSQKNKCLICKQKFVKTPHIDHCHKTNKIRGLLCCFCNTGLGNFKDNQEFLQSAINYLQLSKEVLNGC